MTTKKTTKPKAPKTLDETLGTQEQVTTKAEKIGNQNGYIGHHPAYVLLTVTDSLGDSVQLAFSHEEIFNAYSRAGVNTQAGTPALIKNIVAK
jgi:hypothetical protein